MHPIFTISPTDLTFLWDECPRCFYLKIVHNFKRPYAPFPSIFNRIDKLMKEFFLNQSTNILSPDLPNGKIILTERQVTSLPISFASVSAKVVLRGKIDTAIQFSDGSFGVVDFKTSEAKPDHVAFYGRQLHAYAYALEHPQSGSLHLSPISRMGLLIVEPIKIGEFRENQIAYLGKVTWQEIPKDETTFLNFLEGVISVLLAYTPPEPHPDCAYCQYLQAARKNNL